MPLDRQGRPAVNALSQFKDNRRSKRDRVSFSCS